MNYVYQCPEKDKRDHHPGKCKVHNKELEKVCAHCNEPPAECICN